MADCTKSAGHRCRWAAMVLVMVWWCGNRILVPRWVGRCMRPPTRRWECCSRGWPVSGTGALVVLTHGAVGLAGEDVTDLAGAAVWGLVRSAQAEYPGRVVLVDSDGSLDIAEVIGCGEPQLVVRSGVAHAARLTAAGAGAVLKLPAGRLAIGRWRRRHFRRRGGVPRPGRWSWAAGRCGWRSPRSG